MAHKTIHTCDHCSKTKERERLPKGTKAQAEPEADAIYKKELDVLGHAGGSFHGVLGSLDTASLMVFDLCGACEVLLDKVIREFVNAPPLMADRTETA